MLFHFSMNNLFCYLTDKSWKSNENFSWHLIYYSSVNRRAAQIDLVRSINLDKLHFVKHCIAQEQLNINWWHVYCISICVQQVSHIFIAYHHGCSDMGPQKIWYCTVIHYCASFYTVQGSNSLHCIILAVHSESIVWFFTVHIVRYYSTHRDGIVESYTMLSVQSYTVQERKEREVCHH